MALATVTLLPGAPWPTAQAARPGATEPATVKTTTAADPGTALRSQRSYRLPAVWLQRADGSRQTLQQALSDGRPVVLSFMFSSCATVCPITNQTLAAFSQLLGDRQAAVNIVSISIDPDHDSVNRLADYAKRTGAAGSFYTSDPGTSEAVQRAFDVWRGDKMNHQPVFLVTTNPTEKWLRIEGLVTPRQLLADYLGQVQKTSPMALKK